MKQTLIIILTLVLFASVSRAQMSDSLSNSNSFNERVQSVENGLVDAKTFVKNLDLIFDTKLTGSLPKMNILERMKTYNVPGVSIAVINNFKLEWAKGYGVLESGKDNVVTKETLFQAASTSKPLATSIVLHLVKEGKLDFAEFSGFSQLGFGVFLMGKGENKYFVHPGSNNSGTNCVLAASTSSGNGVIIMTNGISGEYLSMEIIASIAKEYNWHDVK
jgi:hypothetical protein